MAQEFKVGDIVAVKGDPLRQGEVVFVAHDDVQVRHPDTGLTLSYWPDTLVQTGRRIDPAKLASVKALTKALEDAESAAYKLRRFRDAFVLESIVEVEK